jgi:DNA mismatch repair ATPase MutS
VVDAALAGAGRAAYVAHSLSLGGAGGPSLLLLGGPNGSGKSTLLRNVGVLTVLAHVGCWLPAEAARLRLTSRVCARMGMGDDAESNASTFLLEMRETAWLLEQARAPGATALVLIDELGRGTSNGDGASIAWAVAEELALRSSAHTVFASHFHELATLGKLYAEVALARMGGGGGEEGGGEEGGGGGGGGDSGPAFALTAGTLAHPRDDQCGLRVVAALGLPAAFVEDAARIRALLAAGRAEAEGAAARSLAAAAEAGGTAAAATAATTVGRAVRELQDIAASLRAAGEGGGGPSLEDVAAAVQRVRDGFVGAMGGGGGGDDSAAAAKGSPGSGTQPTAETAAAGGASSVPAALSAWEGGDEELCA